MRFTDVTACFTYPVCSCMLVNSVHFNLDELTVRFTDVTACFTYPVCSCMLVNSVHFNLDELTVSEVN